MSLPTISILTPTYNRRHTFRLAIENFYAIDYPQLKIEWIIVDDGTDSIKDMLPKESRIKYYYIDEDKKKELYDEMVSNLNINKNSKKNSKKNKLNKCHKDGFFNNRLPLGMKRNLCNKYASNKIRIHMDDDDYYPKESVSLRLAGLNYKDIDCAFCTTIANFHTGLFKSIINEVPERIPMDRGMSNNTLIYTKNFWEDKHFNNQDLAFEGSNFINGRLRYCKILNYKEIVVGLIHKTNFSNRLKMPEGDPNGWMFNRVSDKMFLLITSFDDKKNNT